MKLLYIATERQAAQGAAHALRAMAPHIALSWARTLASALRWIQDNRDVTAVIVEAEAQRQGVAAFGENVRAVGSAAPVVVVAREQGDLADAVTGALERNRAAARDAAICTTLQSRLFDLEASTASLTEQLRLTAAALADASDSRALLERELDNARAMSAYQRTDFQNSLAARDEEIGQIELERQRLERLLAERDSDLRAQTVQHRAALDKAVEARATEAAAAAGRELQLREQLNRETGARTSLERKLAETQAVAARERTEFLNRLAARDDEIGQVGRDRDRLQQQIDTLRRELKTRQTEAETLRSEVTRIPLLQMQIEQDRQEARSQFERAPSPLCRCTRDGSITQANHSFARLLGYRKAEDLRDTDLASVFECANDLRWLIERSMSTEAAEAVETTWKTMDRRRVHVRLHALINTAGSIDVAIEDITGLREVEERLRLAQRMEAVGRLASEVAVTCESLLREGEVTRVAGLLRQFSVYGDRQITALEPVSMQKVLRNLGPVLKRLAGDDVRIVLPKTSGSFDVDVDAERVERILVNVASYARERMPHGGRIKIELATTVVDRRFLARHPSVRPGTHVLLTVTEVRGGIRGVLPIRTHPDQESAGTASAPKPGVDLGALLGLIADCEGHLWMAAEPSGNMTLKIYLPCRDAVAASDAGAPPARSGRGRQLARWFGH